MYEADSQPMFIIYAVVLLVGSFKHIGRRDSSTQNTAYILISSTIIIVAQHHQNISMVFIKKLAHHVLNILALTLMQAEFSTQEGLVKLKNIVHDRKSVSLRSGKCCGNKKLGYDMYSKCSIDCEPVLSICLYKFGDTNKMCLIRSVAKTSITSQTKELDIQFPETYGGALSLVLTAKDKNSSPGGDVIFQVVFNDRLAFTSTNWIRVASSTTDSPLSFSYKLGCGKDMYGSICNIRCVPKDNGEGHYNCAANGARICLAGWYGSYCDRKCDCDFGTSHGMCTYNGKCKCSLGWAGQSCDKDLHLCFTRSCSNRGICNKSDGTCTCPASFTGKYCENTVIYPSSSINMLKSSRQVESESLLSSSQTNKYSKNIIQTSQTILPTTITRTQSNEETGHSSYSSYHTQQSTSTTYHQRPSLTTSVVIDDIQPTSSKIDVSTLVTSTVWITVTKPTDITISPSTSFHPTIIATTSVAVSLTIILCFFWFLWKRKKQYRRKSQASTIVPITSNQEPDNISRPSTFSSSRSISPLMNYLYANELEPSDLEIISVLDKPIYEGNFNEEESKRYTIKEIDKICMEAIQGRTKQKRFGLQKQNMQVADKKVRVSKTLSNGSCKSEQSDCYCSSGYCSGSSSPTTYPPSSAASSTTLPYPLLDRRRQFEEENNNLTAAKDTSRNSSRNQCFQDEGEEKDENDDFIHQTHTAQHVHFEGLPNFIMYRDEDSAV